MIRNIIFIALLLISVVGCAREESAAQICQETNNILIKHGGEGFTPDAMANCINQGAEQAKSDQEALKNSYKNGA